MQPKPQLVEHILWGVSLILAPLLFAMSTFFWENGEYGTIGGPLLIVASVFWIPAFMGLFALLRNKMPYYSTWGLLVAIYGCIGGSNFGFEGLHNTVFQVSNEMSFAVYNSHPISYNTALFWPGPLFPISLLILGINFIQVKPAPVWVGILIILSAITFPLSRIPLIEGVAHAADLLILLPMVYIGIIFLYKKNYITFQIPC